MQHSQLVPSNTTVAAVVENSALKLSLVNQSQAQPDSVTDSKPQGTLQDKQMRAGYTLITRGSKQQSDGA